MTKLLNLSCPFATKLGSPVKVRVMFWVPTDPGTDTVAGPEILHAYSVPDVTNFASLRLRVPLTASGLLVYVLRVTTSVIEEPRTYTALSMAFYGMPSSETSVLG